MAGAKKPAFEPFWDKPDYVPHHDPVPDTVPHNDARPAGPTGNEDSTVNRLIREAEKKGWGPEMSDKAAKDFTELFDKRLRVRDMYDPWESEFVDDGDIARETYQDLVMLDATLYRRGPAVGVDREEASRCLDKAYAVFEDRTDGRYDVKVAHPSNQIYDKPWLTQEGMADTRRAFLPPEYLAQREAALDRIHVEKANRSLAAEQAKEAEAARLKERSGQAYANDVHISRFNGKVHYDIPYAEHDGVQGRLQGYVNNVDKQLTQTARDAKKGAEFDPQTVSRANVRLAGVQNVRFTPYETDAKGVVVKQENGRPKMDFDKTLFLKMGSEDVAEAAASARKTEVSEYHKFQAAQKSASEVEKATGTAKAVSEKAAETLSVSGPEAGEG